MTVLKVGDIVEIVGSPATTAKARHLIGRRGVVAAMFSADASDKYPGAPCARLSPKELNRDLGWYCRSLRKIDPPDWSPPVTMDREVVHTSEVRT